MADSCATCFFFQNQTIIDEAGNTRNLNQCRRSAPAFIKGGISRTIWPSVQANDWCGEFLVDYPQAVNTALNAALAQISAAAAQTALTTGDAKLTLKTTADAGYVMMDDGTIGSATSGASTRANSDCQTLFLLLWNNIDDTGAPVVTGRGMSAGADWAANKRITLTKQLGRAIAIAGAGSGLTLRTIGRADGTETKTIGAANLPSNTLLNSGLPLTSGDGTGGVGGAGGATGTALDVMNPRSYWNVMLKL